MYTKKVSAGAFLSLFMIVAFWDVPNPTPASLFPAPVLTPAPIPALSDGRDRRNPVPALTPAPAPSIFTKGSASGEQEKAGLEKELTLLDIQMCKAFFDSVGPYGVWIDDKSGEGFRAWNDAATAQNQGRWTRQTEAGTVFAKGSFEFTTAGRSLGAQFSRKYCFLRMRQILPKEKAGSVCIAFRMSYEGEGEHLSTCSFVRVGHRNDCPADCDKVQGLRHKTYTLVMKPPLALEGN